MICHFFKARFTPFSPASSTQVDVLLVPTINAWLPISAFVAHMIADFNVAFCTILVLAVHAEEYLVFGAAL